ncbi:hypothetical protein LOTGIDRAFT_163189 [Lottia gigantea]|uniref:Uncharacterized protein n=1 Tax=Lottia gigantea TaxID=225164 RepID=V4A555_LOTGI|nr:hypothetical protein LOTGIDRAFT_163189 [Lottia gigantea]ESO91827.1 hypothetical protein LOTGIDRAFT_163189 [Lottia gigantea]
MLHNSNEIKQHFNLVKNKQKYYHDKPSTNQHKKLQPGDEVRMAPQNKANVWSPAIVIEHHKSPRSYIVESNGTKYRRNHRDLRSTTKQANSGTQLVCNPPEEPQTETKLTPNKPEPKADISTDSQPYTTRHGRVTKPPNRLNL